MNEKIPKPHNPETNAAHRREVWWQITVPLLILTMIFVGLAVFFAMQPAARASVWADVSLIFLIGIGFVPMFLLLVASAGLAYALWRANRGLPAVTWQIQGFVQRAQEKTVRITDKVTAPIIKVGVLHAKWQALWSRKHKLVDHTRQETP